MGRKKVTSSAKNKAREYRKKLRETEDVSENSVHPPSPIGCANPREVKKITAEIGAREKKLWSRRTAVKKNDEAAKQNDKAAEPITTSAAEVAIETVPIQVEPTRINSPAKENPNRELVFSSPTASARHSEPVAESEEETNSPHQAPVDEGNDGSASDRISASPAGLLLGLCTPPARTDNVDEPTLVHRLPTPCERNMNDPDFDETLESGDPMEMEEILRAGVIQGVDVSMDIGVTIGLDWTNSGNDEAGNEEPVVDNLEESESESESASEEEQEVEKDVEEFESEQEEDEEEEEEEEDVVDVVGKPDQPWKLVEAVEGGPREIELLRGYLSHVSHFIWRGKNERVIVQRDTMPGWLGYLLGKTFSGKCQSHDLPKNDLNRYCITCDASICKLCTDDNHIEHNILTIYKHVYQAAVPLDEMKQHLDCEDIQPYRCNKKLVVSLIPLPHNGSGSLIEGNGACTNTICRRKLTDSCNFRFCSIKCKYEAVGGTTHLHGPVEDVEEQKLRKGSRKGVSHRAPFF